MKFLWIFLVLLMTSCSATMKYRGECNGEKYEVDVDGYWHAVDLPGCHDDGQVTTKKPVLMRKGRVLCDPPPYGVKTYYYEGRYYCAY
ncbi:MAG: hypothetical protein DRQ04_06545 [Candidatus Hydrothermota bacterium]|nr:MAG: hypothetical protein DRQ04_06545 [Candidatus Hydrothermae bacterium]